MSRVAYGSQVGSASEITTNNSSIFVIPSQVVSDASANATYHMSVSESSPSDTTSAVKYDYVYDYELTDAGDAAAFCNAFTVTGANAYDQGSNSASTAALSEPEVVKGILLKAFSNAVAASGQSAQADVPTRESITGQTIDATLTSILRKFVDEYSDATFDADYYADAVGAQTSLSTSNVEIGLDKDDSAAAALKSAAAAANAVADGGAIKNDATTLAHQIPASNMRLYEDSTSAIPTALLLKGGDTVVIGLSVTLDDVTAVCANSGTVTNSGLVANTHPSVLSAETLTVTSPFRAVELAIRLKMPGSGTAISGVRAA
jgi:hypothetical protein